MDEERELRRIHYRIYGLIAFLCLSLITYGVLLFDAQVVHGKEYLEQSVRTITRREKVEAARGILTDRNGQPLVGNRLSYTLTFDAALLDEGSDPNEAILRLLQLCQGQGVAWVDNLPLSTTAPFVYTLEQQSQPLRSRFLKFLQYEDGKKKNSWVSESLELEFFTSEYLLSVGLTPDVLLKKMGEYFALSSQLSPLEQRNVLGVQYEVAVRKVVNTTAYILAEDVTTAMVTLLADGGYDGVKVGSSSVREIKTDYAAHILGSVGRIDDYESLKDQGYQMDDFIGRSGVESAFEQYLRGIDGTRVVSSNSEGKTTSVLYSTAPQPGSTVALTIDLEFQAMVEEILGETISTMTEKDGIARGAGAAVISIGSGEILSLASYPTFDLTSYNRDFNTLQSDPAQPLFNRATQGTYAPGSTFKPLTAVAALESGVITTTQQVRDTGRWVYPRSPSDGAYCWNRSGHGLMNVTQAITVSCNYFFAEMGYRLGMTTLNDYARAFGLGEPTGIEIFEETGNLAENKAGENQAPWAAFGQAAYLFSPLQLANFTATLAGGGAHYPAHLLKSVKSYDNSQILKTGESSPGNIVEMSPSTLFAVKQGMLDLTTKGSLSSYFRSCVVSAGAKTGTAQINKTVKDTGVFICFAPYDEPEIAVAIVIEKGGSGAALASTAVKILNAYFTAAEQGIAISGEGQLLP